MPSARDGWQSGWMSCFPEMFTEHGVIRRQSKVDAVKPAAVALRGCQNSIALIRFVIPLVVKALPKIKGQRALPLQVQFPQQ
jgi:hypothetical protein